MEFPLALSRWFRTQDDAQAIDKLGLHLVRVLGDEFPDGPDDYLHQGADTGGKDRLRAHQHSPPDCGGADVLCQGREQMEDRGLHRRDPDGIVVLREPRCPSPFLPPYRALFFT